MTGIATAWRGGRSLTWFIVVPVLVALRATTVHAWVDLDEYPGGAYDTPDGIHVTDGSFVMNVGELQINITNHGLIGSQFSVVSTYADAPSAQWPAGSGNEYLWAAGLWVGGVQLNQPLVSTGQFEREFRPQPDLEATIYEARDSILERPPGRYTRGNRVPSPEPDDDGDGRIDEETLDGYDDDDDGLVDEDFGQIGDQMMVCTMYDNTRLAQEIYPDHMPLNLKVVQKCFAWNTESFRNFVGFEYEITNVGALEIQDVYVGLFADCDIGPRGQADIAKDDLSGYYSGLVRAVDGTFIDVSVGYMYDGSEDNPLPGYFGIVFLGPRYSLTNQIRSYQNFSGIQPFEYGGDPTDDAGRYELMSAYHHDPDTRPDKQNDFRFLVSTGPWPFLNPGQTIRFHVGIVVGEGLRGLLQDCANAALAWRGTYANLDGLATTGVRGRETLLCFPGIPHAGHWIYSRVADFLDGSCVGADVRRYYIRPEHFTMHPGGQACIWVNRDNCEECDRLAGAHCTKQNRNFEYFWNCNQTWLLPQERFGCTGIGGAESRIPWVVTRVPPPAPGMRIWPVDNAVHVFWNDLSERVMDPMMSLPDFESYRIWRADNWDRPYGSSLENGPETDLWQLIAEYDVVNSFVRERQFGETVLLDTLDLGQNTGLDAITYRPICLDDSRFSGLAEAMQSVVERDSLGLYLVRPPLRDSYGSPVPGLESLLPWESYPAELDTFFLVTAREADPDLGVVPKPPVKFYEYVDHHVHNGFIYFYSVTAVDHGVIFRRGRPRVVGEGLSGQPSSSFMHAVPGTGAQSAEDRTRVGPNIFVYPNPASLSALEEFQVLHPSSQDPSGQRVMFANLPAAHNKISIFTLDGDLVEELWHDGSRGHGEVAWNLVSRNGQRVASGIYIYVVESDDDRFNKYTDKFVVIK